MTVPGVAADILREVIPQVDSIRMRIMILEPFYWGEGRAEDAVWEALLYAGDHGIKLDKSYWPAIVQLAKEEEFEDVLKDVDPSIFE
ncbi:MAG: hypothetical protein Q4D87_05620 [Actinomycetaceae bacterium]|nr:hypothetical protein [Actinomycetaceae bacterium]